LFKVAVNPSADGLQFLPEEPVFKRAHFVGSLVFVGSVRSRTCFILMFCSRWLLIRRLTESGSWPRSQS